MESPSDISDQAGVAPTIAGTGSNVAATVAPTAQSTSAGAVTSDHTHGALGASVHKARSADEAPEDSSLGGWGGTVTGGPPPIAATTPGDTAAAPDAVRPVAGAALWRQPTLVVYAAVAAALAAMSLGLRGARNRWARASAQAHRPRHRAPRRR